MNDRRENTHIISLIHHIKLKKMLSYVVIIYYITTNNDCLWLMNNNHQEGESMIVCFLPYNMNFKVDDDMLIPNKSFFVCK